MYHNQGTSEESERPRRLEDNTAAYLLSIAAKIDETSKLPKSDESTEEQEILVNNVFEEIKSRTASAACDRRTNSVIEQLLLMAHLEVLIEAMSKFTPYAKFLSLNRHSSHVLEALFSRTSYIFKYVGIAPEMEREALNAILTMATAIFNSLDLLIKDVCGSHVIRSLLCLLTGIPAVGEKKGKNAKHQHNISLSVSMLDLMESNKFYINKAYCYQVPESFHEALTSDVVMYLQNKTHEELQALVCETNSCAVIILLLRILYNPHVIENGIEMANNLIVKCLNVPAVEEDMIDFMLTSLSGAGEEKKRKKDKKDKKKKKNKESHEMIEGINSVSDDNNGWSACQEVLLNMMQDKTCTYFLECVFECFDLKHVCGIVCNVLLYHNELLRNANDSTGNYVIQACCRRFSVEVKASNKHGVNFHAAYPLVRKVSETIIETLFDTTTDVVVEGENTTTTVSISKARYEMVLYKGGVVLWCLDLVKAIDYVRYLEETMDFENKDTLSNKIGMIIVYCWLYQYKQLKAEVRVDDEQADSNIELNCLKATLMNPYPKSVTQAQINQLIYYRLTPSESSADVPVPVNKKKKNNKKKKFQKETPAVETEINTTQGLLSIHSQILFAKQLEALIRLLIIHDASKANTPPVVCKVSKNILTSISSISTDILLNIAKQGQLSKPILDTFIEYVMMHNGSSTSNSKKPVNNMFVEDFRRFHGTLLKCAVELASHPTGLHTIRKIYEATEDISIKESFVSLFNSNYDLIISATPTGGSRGVGRYLLCNICNADIYHSQGVEAWKNNISKQKKSVGLLEELDELSNRKRKREDS